jgi:hypothetical protein
MNQKMIMGVVLLLVAVSGCKNIQIEDTSGEQIPVLGWYGIPSEYASVERYKDMVEAGFTIDFPHAHNFVSEPDKCFAALDAAQAAGIQLGIMANALLEFSEADRAKLMAHPALHHYHILDEPSAKIFADLAAKVKAVQAIDKQHPCYINLYNNYAGDDLLGTNGYHEHVQRFIREVPVPFISFDHYPIRLDKETQVRSVRPEFYENLEIIADESKKVGKPFWAFALSTAHMDYPVPTLADLRLQVYSDLAYGAQCIQYFTWFDPWGETPDDDAPIRIDGTISNSYYTVQAMNKEIIALSKVFLNSRTVWTAHTGIIPQGCTELDKSKLPPVIQSLEISGSGALVSLLEKGADRFLVIVNHDINEEITVRVTGRSDLRMVNKDGSIAPIMAEQVLTPGDAVILFWKK